MKLIKKITSALLSLSLAASMFAVPTTASAESMIFNYYLNPENVVWEEGTVKCFKNGYIRNMYDVDYCVTLYYENDVEVTDEILGLPEGTLSGDYISGTYSPDEKTSIIVTDTYEEACEVSKLANAWIDNGLITNAKITTANYFACVDEYGFEVSLLEPEAESFDVEALGFEDVQIRIQDDNRLIVNLWGEGKKDYDYIQSLHSALESDSRVSYVRKWNVQCLVEHIICTYDDILPATENSYRLTYDDCLKYNKSAMIDIFPGLRELYEAEYASCMAEYADSMEQQFASVKGKGEKLYTLAEIEAMTSEEFYTLFPEAKSFAERRDKFIDDETVYITEYLEQNYGKSYHAYENGELLPMEEVLEREIKSLKAFYYSCSFDIEHPKCRSLYTPNETEATIEKLLDGYDYYISSPITKSGPFDQDENGKAIVYYKDYFDVQLKQNPEEFSEEEFDFFLRFFCCMRQLAPMEHQVGGMGGLILGGFFDYEMNAESQAIHNSIYQYFSNARVNEDGENEISIELTEEEITRLETFEEGENPFISKAIANGDVTADEKLDIYDVIWLSKGMVGMIELTEVQLVVADYNSDGKVDLYDAVEIAKTLI